MQLGGDEAPEIDAVGSLTALAFVATMSQEQTAVSVKDAAQGGTIGSTTTYGFRLVTDIGSPVPYYAGVEYKRGAERR